VAALFGAAGADPSYGRRLPAALADAGLAGADDIELFLTTTASPSVYYASSFMISVWGQKPLA